MDLRAYLRFYSCVRYTYVLTRTFMSSERRNDGGKK